MSDQKPSISVAPLKLGDRVQIKGRDNSIGKIVEYRGPLGPKGAPIYGIELQTKPVSSYIELREDQIEHATPPNRTKGFEPQKTVPKRTKKSKNAVKRG